MQAKASAEELQGIGQSVNGTSQFGQYPTDVMGSHGKVGRFNVVFADSHVATLAVRKSGTLHRPQDFMPHPYWRYHWRGPEWRYDNFPAEHIRSNPD